MPRSTLGPRFTFIDLFAGVGGFHSALTDLGGECVLACEIDRRARAVYERNWGIARGRFPEDAWALTEAGFALPKRCDVLTAGFPCQPFSKSGKQLGRRDQRGTLFDAIVGIVDRYLQEGWRPIPVLLLENVRNLTGPRHREDWLYIIEELRRRGYRVSDEPTIFSPHLLPPERGGTPQHRERVFIGAVHTPDGSGRHDRPSQLVPNEAVGAWDPDMWNVLEFVAKVGASDTAGTSLTDLDLEALDAWEKFVRHFRGLGVELPGFPIWTEYFGSESRVDPSWPAWKRRFVSLNRAFYQSHKGWLDGWMRDALSETIIPSRRKLEWQAGPADSIWDTTLQFRPSGIRCKALTYLPALVAITQTSVIGPLRRYLTPLEAAALQGLPPTFSFGDQSPSESFRQAGNAVATGAVKYVLRRLITESSDLRLPTGLRELTDGPSRSTAIPQTLPSSGEALSLGAQ